MEAQEGKSATLIYIVWQSQMFGAKGKKQIQRKTEGDRKKAGREGESKK